MEVIIMLNELYEIKNDSPKPIEWEKYCEEILKDYQKLLNNYQNIVEDNGAIRLQGYQVLILEM